MSVYKNPNLDYKQPIDKFLESSYSSHYGPACARLEITTGEEFAVRYKEVVAMYFKMKGIHDKLVKNLNFGKPYGHPDFETYWVDTWDGVTRLSTRRVSKKVYLMLKALHPTGEWKSIIPNQNKQRNVTKN